ncbi:MAG TPA: DegT/DnrJ/EryC1/StrS family aminotransferase [Ilumatobacter sp.]|nr:DegT/DnrJ/EryC1/StrS family aminotransferase [Ilumatobacter sp.]
MLPVVDLSRRGARYADAFAAAARRIAIRGQFLLGPELDALERQLADHAGARFAVGVASGAAALQLALQSAGIGPGDDVLVPGFTAVPTASAVMAAGARPVVVDVDPDTACVTPNAIADARTPATRAVIVVHLYGYLADLPARTDDLIVIEDAAQASGAHHGPLRSTASAYSFYPTKNLGGIGDGGAVLTDDETIAAAVRRRRVHGMTELYRHEEVSQNFRMSELEAAWLGLTLPGLDDDVHARRRIAATYRAAAPHLRWQRTDPSHGYHLCVFRSPARDDQRRRLAEAGIATAVHYPAALTQQPAYRELFGGAHCPESEAWARECVSVPCFPEMTDDEVQLVADALASLPAGEPT